MFKPDHFPICSRPHAMSTGPRAPLPRTGRRSPGPTSPRSPSSMTRVTRSPCWRDALTADSRAHNPQGRRSRACFRSKGRECGPLVFRLWFSVTPLDAEEPPVVRVRPASAVSRGLSGAGVEVTSIHAVQLVMMVARRVRIARSCLRSSAPSLAAHSCSTSWPVSRMLANAACPRSVRWTRLERWSSWSSCRSR